MSFSQGFSTSICGQGETPTSNIMDFRLFPSLPTFLLMSAPLIESAPPHSGWNSPPSRHCCGCELYFEGGRDEFSHSGLREVTNHRHRGGCGWTRCTPRPWTEAPTVVFYFIASVSIPRRSKKRESRWANAETSSSGWLSKWRGVIDGHIDCSSWEERYVVLEGRGQLSQRYTFTLTIASK